MSSVLKKLGFSILTDSNLFINDKLCIDYYFFSINGKNYAFCPSRKIGIRIEKQSSYKVQGKEVNWELLYKRYEKLRKRGDIKRNAYF